MLLRGGVDDRQAKAKAGSLAIWHAALCEWREHLFAFAGWNAVSLVMHFDAQLLCFAAQE